jgi:Domain of unknown function (DUF5103)
VDKKYHSMKQLLTLVCIAFSAFYMGAQNIDTIFSETVRSVEFRSNGDFKNGNLPVMPLKGGNLVLSFDDLNASFSNFSYTVELCDRDWKPTRLEKIEYLEGLNEDRITDFKNSQATNVPYVNYHLTIPNQVMRWNKSGNYLLKVYEDDGDKTPVLTRRFIVFEPILLPAVEFEIPVGFKFNSCHEIDFKLEAKNFRVSNPTNEIRATVLQNGRWETAKSNVRPSFVVGDQITFDYQDSLIWTAGKEWRYVDIRSSRFRSERINTIINGEKTWEILMRPDYDRSREPYLIYPDLNGGYFIETQDYRNQGGGNARIQADYVNLFPILKLKDAVPNADVYMFGQMTDWKIDERFKLEYDEARSEYAGEIQLKQGFYNYSYMAVSKKTGLPDYTLLEGDWYETENEYHVIVYYRPFGARYDRVIGYQKALSSRR